MTSPIYIALGTNLGDREANLRTARESLPPEVRVVQESSIYITEPWGYLEQPEFLNQVIEVETLLHPLPLLHRLKKIEIQMGREETLRNGPRLIDLDLLFYGGEVIKGEILQVPHPRLHKRAFVLVPLNEIAPDFLHPLLGEPIQDLLGRVDTSGVRPF